MIIAFYTTKGGAGKSSSIVSLCSALAEGNKADQSPMKVCVVDADQQASVMRFASSRAARELPNYGVSFVSMTPTSTNISRLRELDSHHDVVLVDLPGHYTDEVALMAIQADLIVVPTKLTVIEALPMTEVYNQLEDLINQKKLDTRLAILTSRNNRNFQFETAEAKALLHQLQQSGYTFLKASLSDQVAVNTSVSSGYYLFELMEQNPQAKSPSNAQSDARSLLRSCLTFDVVVMEEEEHE